MASCLVCQLRKLGNNRDGFFFFLQLLNVLCGNWEENGKLLKGLKKKQKERLESTNHMRFWGAVLSFGAFQGLFSPLSGEKNLLVRFETEFSLFIYLESFLYCVRNNSSQIIPWELQILWITGNYLFLVVPTGHWVSEYSTAVTVPIVFLLQRQKSKGVFAVGGIVTDLVWESSKLIYTITIWSYDNVFFFF